MRRLSTNDRTKICRNTFFRGKTCCGQGSWLEETPVPGSRAFRRTFSNGRSRIRCHTAPARCPSTSRSRSPDRNITDYCCLTLNEIAKKNFSKNSNETETEILQVTGKTGDKKLSSRYDKLTFSFESLRPRFRRRFATSECIDPTGLHICKHSLSSHSQNNIW